MESTTTERMALVNSLDERRHSSLHIACCLNHVAIARLLVDAGAKIVVVDPAELSCILFAVQQSPLPSINAFVIAVEQNHEEILDLLIQSSSLFDLNRHCPTYEVIDFILSHDNKLQIANKLVN